MAALASLADPGAVSDGWRPLTTAEAGRVDALVAKASRLIRDELPSVDARILAGALDPLSVADIVCDMVRRQLGTPTDQPPASQVTQSASIFSVGVTYANPTGEPFLTKSERRRLGVGRQRAGSVDLLPPAG